LNLQMFAEEKREAPTPRRRRRARERGQVFRSAELTAAAVLLMSFAALRLTAPWMAGALKSLMRRCLSAPCRTDFTAGSTLALGSGVGGDVLWAVVPVMAAAAAAGLGANLAQVGFLFTTRPLSPDLNRLNPVSGLTRMFSKRALIELFKATTKIAAVGSVAFLTVQQNLPLLPRMLGADLGSGIDLVAGATGTLVVRVALVMAIIAAVDFFYQRYEHEVGLRMSRRELKDELKEVEGDPQVRGRIRQRQRQIARRRMMADVAKADVVVTNPVHYAVALRYDAGRAPAPVVVAKGRGVVAERIKAEARKHGVAVVENPPLAQALYKAVEIGSQIPADLYRAVAEVLAFVYRLKGRI